MDSMIERAARAIYEARISHLSWDDQAQAAIEAMREVTNEMRLAGLAAFTDAVTPHNEFEDGDSDFTRGRKVGNISHTSAEIEAAWDAMIDAALGKDA